MLSLLRQTVLVFVALTLITGVAYPLLMTVVAQVVFPHQANGSLIEMRRQSRRLRADRPAVRRSELFLGPAVGDVAGIQRRRLRPAATLGRRTRLSSMPCEAASKRLKKAIQTNRAGAGRSGDGVRQRARSAHQPGGGRYQVERVAKARGIDAKTVRDSSPSTPSDGQLGVLGEPRVNVWKLNLALDALSK